MKIKLVESFFYDMQDDLERVRLRDIKKGDIILIQEPSFGDDELLLRVDTVDWMFLELESNYEYTYEGTVEVSFIDEYKTGDKYKGVSMSHWVYKYNGDIEALKKEYN